MKKGKRLLTIFVGVCLVLVLALVPSCAEPAPTPTPTPTPGPTPSPVPTPTPTPTPVPTRVIDVVYNTHEPSTSSLGRAIQAWADKVEELSGGQVKFTIYWSSGLFTHKEAIKSVLAGMADMHHLLFGEHPGILTMNLWPDIPFSGIRDATTGTAIARELFDTFPELKAEFQGLEVMSPLIVRAENCIFSKNKLVQTSADLKGMKFVAFGVVSEWLEMMGATVVFVSGPDLYMALDKGVFEAHQGGWPPLMSMGLIELYRYATIIPRIFGTSIYAHIVNPDFWEGLPADIKGVFDEAESFYTETAIKNEAEGDVTAKAEANKRGYTIITLSEDVVQEWVQSCKPYHEKWIENVEAEGKPGRAMYDKLQELIAKYK